MHTVCRSAMLMISCCGSYKTTGEPHNTTLTLKEDEQNAMTQLVRNMRAEFGLALHTYLNEDITAGR